MRGNDLPFEVVLPDGNIGVNDFATAVNHVIDIRTTKKINGTMINKQLKKLGILSEEKTEEGKTRTVQMKNLKDTVFFQPFDITMTDNMNRFYLMK